MVSLRFVSLAIFITLISACKAPTEAPDSGDAGSKDGAQAPVEEPEDPKTFLEYVIIETRLECLSALLADQPDQLEQANKMVLAHHEVTPKWLAGRRELAKTDMKKANKSKLLFEEARASVCPAGKPDQELRQIIGKLAPGASAAQETPAAENAEQP
jgi:hypothetical protein